MLGILKLAGGSEERGGIGVGGDLGNREATELMEHYLERDGSADSAPSAHGVGDDGGGLALVAGASEVRN